jgi:hypothetical protein
MQTQTHREVVSSKVTTTYCGPAHLSHNPHVPLKFANEPPHVGDPGDLTSTSHMVCILDNQGRGGPQFNHVGNEMPYYDGEGILPTLCVHLIQKYNYLNSI